MNGFTFPRQFRESTLAESLSRNMRELVTFMNSFVVRFDADGETLSLPGDLSVAGSSTLADVTADSLTLGGTALGAWQSWTPSTVTNFTLGNGTYACRYTQIGKLVVAYFEVTFGTTTSITGAQPTWNLPVTAASADYVNLGSGRALENGVASYYVDIRKFDASTLLFRPLTANLTYVSSANLSATVPFTWGTGDKIEAAFAYEAA